MSGAPGAVTQTRRGRELADAYQDYLGKALPANLRRKYFQEDYTQYDCAESGLRWYYPMRVADSDLYEYLGTSFDWYYEDSWDDCVAVKVLRKLGATGFTEIGCGPGSFIRLAARAGIAGSGIDLNDEAVAKAQADGVDVHHEAKLPGNFRFSPVLCLFQTLEHVADPLAFVEHYIRKSGCRQLLISVPTFESLYGLTSDPLAWPPHHTTFWSGKALELLAARCGFKVIQTHYQPLSGFRRFRRVWGREGGRPLPGSRFTLAANPLRSRLHFLRSKAAGCLWARREHTLLAVLAR